MTRVSALAAIDLPQAARFAYRMIWHERTQRDPAHVWLRGALADAVLAERPF